MQKEIEASAVMRTVKSYKKFKIQTWGKNDDFFMGEEFKDFEKMNPNVDMGFWKFALKPNPDFVVQAITDHIAEDIN